jgi:DNA polymerase III sliding clamp (beta) subunit (PCNA family)
MYYDLTRKVDSEEVTKSTSEFKRVMDEISPQVSNDEIRDLLAGLNISLQ